MTINFSKIAAQAATDRIISDEEVLDLRRDGWCDGTISPEEADAIFSMNEALDQRSDIWVDFFAEAIGEHLLNTMEPRGYMSQEMADWLVTKVKNDGQIDSMAELELLVRMIERASNVPDSLKDFVLHQIEREVLSGTGPTRCGGELSDTHVSAAEANILRRVVFGQASDRPAAVSRREAEVLFRLKDATLSAPNAPAWKRLFVQAVGNYLQGFSPASGQLSRERAGELESFMNDTSSHVGGFMKRMASALPNSAGVVFGRKTAPKPDRDAKIAADEIVTNDEQAWLDRQVGANGQVDEYDAALLAFLAGGEPPPA